MFHQLKNPNFYLILLIDASLFALAHIGSYLLRFEFKLTPLTIEQIKLLLPYIVVFKLTFFYIFGLYKGMWRYTSLTDLYRLVQACLIVMLSLISFVLIINRFEGFSRAVFFLDGLLSFILVGALRTGIRYYYTRKNNQVIPSLFSAHKKSNKEDGWKSVLIIGAGDAGEQILREINRNAHLRYHVVGFLDDNPAKQGRSVHRVPVLGSIEDLPKITKSHHIKTVLIAMPSAKGDVIRCIVELCEASGVQYKTLPGLSDIIDGKARVNQIRDVDYQDLLGRAPVRLDTSGINTCLADKVVLITGCGGSIGSELCRQIVRFQPRKLILIDAGEENLFNIQMELQYELGYHNYHTFLSRVQNRAITEKIFQTFSPNVVFHAAAYKHVPMMEVNPWEAFFNNILGSLAVMDMAAKYRAERFVLVSTDKAVRPTNVMGASKRVAELLLQSFHGNHTLFMAVRFGNVLGSSGSVIPLFKRQIERGGPVTVTHPEATRYFMTIPESAQLILQAGAMGKGGEIFVLKMGTPVKILDMAKDLIRLVGKDPGKDIDIVFSGLRQGEKLNEELITDDEDVVQTEHDDIMILKSNGKINGTENPQELSVWLKKYLEELYKSAVSMDPFDIKSKLRSLVPEYIPENKPWQR